MHSYGISVTTMEEVFLKIACDNDEPLRSHLDAASSKSNFSNNGESPRPALPRSTLPRELRPACRGVSRWLQHFRACFVKHALSARRERWAALTQLAVPLLLVLGAVYVGNTRFVQSTDPPLLLNRETALSGYGGSLGATDVRIPALTNYEL